VAPPFVQYNGASKNSSSPPHPVLPHNHAHSHTHSHPHCPNHAYANNGTTKPKSPHITPHATLVPPPHELDESDEEDGDEESDSSDEDDALDYDSDDSEPDHLNQDLSANDQFSDFWSSHDFALHGDSQNVLVSFLVYPFSTLLFPFYYSLSLLYLLFIFFLAVITSIWWVALISFTSFFSSILLTPFLFL
jgi:hypothetical protein